MKRSINRFCGRRGHYNIEHYKKQADKSREKEDKKGVNENIPRTIPLKKDSLIRIKSRTR